MNRSPHMRAFSHTYGKTDRLCRSSDDRSCRSTLPLLPSTKTLSRSAAPYVAASSLRCSILQHRARPYLRGSPRPPAFAADGRCPTATSTSRLKSKSITSSGLRQITVFRSRRPVCRRTSRVRFASFRTSHIAFRKSRRFAARFLLCGAVALRIRATAPLPRDSTLYPLKIRFISDAARRYLSRDMSRNGVIVRQPGAHPPISCDREIPAPAPSSGSVSVSVCTLPE